MEQSLEELIGKVLDNSEASIKIDISKECSRAYASQKDNQDGDEVCAKGKDLKEALKNLLLFWNIEKSEENQPEEKQNEKNP